MILGLSTSAFTTLHTVISLIGIASGFLALADLLANVRRDGVIAVFLVTTIATSVTGFLFPFSTLLPSHIVALISLGLLAAAVLAFYVFGLAGIWRPVFVVTAVASLYLNVFVLVAQGFQKVPALKALAPTQAEPPFAIAQLAVLAAFLVAGWRALARFRPSATAHG